MRDHGGELVVKVIQRRQVGEVPVQRGRGHAAVRGTPGNCGSATKMEEAPGEASAAAWRVGSAAA